ncbi:hypothetical protein AGMMS49545_07250 [Betaproteobacteria bacterium]|nr:hypothetical protein AGMMS49545_07250 [Betaproteobacteria bacterium]GHU46558.1 hypothetical protein AGMMS50289_20240 [Betaproteobacteria bacterium]
MVEEVDEGKPPREDNQADEQPRRLLIRQLALQTAAVFLALSLAWPFYFLRATEWNWAAVSAATGAIAFLFARLSRQQWWWQLIHLLFVPLLWIGLQFNISPLWYLGAFMLLLLIFRGAATGQIPLYLSGENAAKRLHPLLAEGSALLDVGAGIASLLLPLAKMRPDLSLAGIDNAPLPWFVGWLRTRNTRIGWFWGDFWKHSLAPYQVVYCFLSPAPMRALWAKACREMTPGSLFISNAFPVDDATEEAEIMEDAESGLVLYLYKIRGEGES